MGRRTPAVPEVTLKPSSAIPDICHFLYTTEIFTLQEYSHLTERRLATKVDCWLNSTLCVTRWQKLEALRRTQKWPQNFCQPRICYFCEKCIVFARESKLFGEHCLRLRVTWLSFSHTIRARDGCDKRYV